MAAQERVQKGQVSRARQELVAIGSLKRGDFEGAARKTSTGGVP